MILRINSDHFLSSINQLIVVLETCCIFFEVRTEFFHIIYMSFRFERIKLEDNLNLNLLFCSISDVLIQVYFDENFLRFTYIVQLTIRPVLRFQNKAAWISG
jgi:hypothetical protein